MKKVILAAAVKRQKKTLEHVVLNRQIQNSSIIGYALNLQRHKTTGKTQTYKFEICIHSGSVFTSSSSVKPKTVVTIIA
jgi:hypothetical protein